MTLIPTSILLITLSAAPVVPANVPVPSAEEASLATRVDLRSVIKDPSLYRAQAPSTPTPTQGRKRSALRTLAGAVGGFFVGAFSGALIGERLQGPCHCDDQGLDGMVRGIWIGGFAGAILLGYLAGK